MAVIAAVAKLVMMYDESWETERVVKTARRLAEEQEEMEGRVMTSEEWVAVQSARPLTPYDSSLPREGAHIRTDARPTMGHIGTWASLVIQHSMKQTEEASTK